MTTIHDRLTETGRALTLLRSIVPPDEDGELYIGAISQVVEITWVRPDATQEWHHPDDETKAQAREAARQDALAFLGRWTNRLLKVAEPGSDVVKTFGDYKVSVEVKTAEGWRVRAGAHAEQVCTFEPELDAQGQPVIEAYEDYEAPPAVAVTKTRPKLRKICPPSFLAGVSEAS